MKAAYHWASLALILIALTPSFADTANPVIGRWTLDVAKSSFGADPTPKSGTRTYVDSPNGIVMTEVLVDQEGKEQKRVFTIKEDGKPHAFTESDDFDAVTAMVKGPRETEFVVTKAGKRVETLKRVLSEDGKTLTLHFVGVEKGAKVDVKLVYQRI